MILKNSMSIVSSRFGLVYKVLLYAFIILLLVCMITVSVLYPVLKPIIIEIKDIGIVRDVVTIVKSALNGDVNAQQEAYANLENDFQQIGKMITLHYGNFVWGIVIIILFIFMGYFFLSLSYYPAADVLYNFMNNNSKFGFTSNFFFNLKNSLKFSGLMSLISIPIYALIFGAVVLMWLICSKISIWLCLPLCFGIYLFLSSLKLSVFSDWLPNMIIDRKSVGKALSDSVKTNTRRLPTMLNIYFTFTLLYAAFSFLISIATLGFALIFAPVLKIIFNRTIELVAFHQSNDLPYYTVSKSWSKANES